MPLHPEYEAMLAPLNAIDAPALADLPVEVAVAASRENYRTMQPEAPEIEVGSVEDIEVSGEVGPIGARVYTPAREGPHPIVVMYHGGGCVIGDLTTADSQCREVCRVTDSVVVSIDYRLAPEHPFPCGPEDCYAATRWVHENAASLGGDANRLAVMGDSAGGYLATVVALMSRDRGGPPIALQVMAYPMLDGTRFDTPSYGENAEGYLLSRDTMLWFWDRYVPDAAERANGYASPLRADDLGGLPPARIYTAEFDPLRDEAAAYAERLEAAGVDVRYRCFEGLIHGFLSHTPRIAASRPAVAEICDAINDVLGS